MLNVDMASLCQEAAPIPLRMQMLGATLKEELPQLMKNIIVIAIVVAIGWYGNYLYKQHGYNTDFVRNSSIDLANEKKVKCITKTGSVIYGTVPQGTICEKLELIEGSLTAVSSETHTESGYSSSSLSGFLPCRMAALIPWEDSDAAFSFD